MLNYMVLHGSLPSITYNITCLLHTPLDGMLHGLLYGITSVITIYYMRVTLGRFVIHDLLHVRLHARLHA